MKRFAMLVVAAAVVGTGISYAQQPVQPRPRTTRSYRSYSVSPSTRGNAAQRSRAAAEATWRHADAKPQGQFHSGR
jgi:hypothetical protein